MRKMKGNILNDLMEKMLSHENLNAWNDSAILPFDDNIPENFENANPDLSAGEGFSYQTLIVPA